MSSIIQHIVDLVTVVISHYGYLGVGIAMAFESACIPIPSEVILPFGGFLVFQGHLNFLGVVLAGTVGGTLGSIGAYLVGLKGGRPFIERYGSYFFISANHFQAADAWFKKYGQATVFFTRLMPVIRTFISLPAGIAAMDFPRFVVYTFLGSLPWSILLTYVGLKLGQNWETLSPLFHRFDLLVIFLLLLAVIALWLRRKKRGPKF